jgi:hypothetical protein
VAKSRSKKTRKAAKSTARTARKRVGARKAKAKTSRVRALKPAGKDVLDLKKLRRDLERAVTVLGRKTTRDPQGQQALDAAQERMTRWIAEADQFCTEEMQEVCGPTMAIPLEE